LMLQSGLWPALRTRPFDRIPDPDSTPDAIFVTAIDTAPHAPDPAFVLAERGEDFARGTRALNHLTEGPVFICQSARTPLVQAAEQLIPVRWAGPHPAGLVGTHVARLFPLKDSRVIWHINYQDVIALGTLIATGQPDPLRTITLGGPGLRNPAYRRVPLGTDLHELLRPNLTAGQKLILSGSPLSGRESQYLSRYHLQASVRDAPPEKSRHWLVEALNKVACPAPFIPTQALEQALGPDLPATPLLRALSIGDADRALQLGCLHLGEEDLALASYVTGGITDFGRRLRVVLNMLEAGS